MKLVDAIMFNNEYDMLDIRLEIMGDHVDEIVIVECDQTHAGSFKGFNLEKQWDRYKKWHHKINYIKSENVLNNSDAWKNEYTHRDQMNLGLSHLNDEDIFIISDCDEIVRPEILEMMRKSEYDHYRIVAPVFYFKFNYVQAIDPPIVWSKAFRGKYKNIPASHFRYDKNPRNHRETINIDNQITIPHAGWHFSWLGDVNFIKNKLTSFAHTELNTDDILNGINIDDSIANGIDHLQRGQQSTGYRSVSFNEYFPEYLIQNKEKYKNFIISNVDKDIYEYIPK